MVLLSACAIGGDVDSPEITTYLSGAASVKLSNASLAVTQTSDSSWELDKTGSLSGSTVTWNITATKTATASGRLVLQGQMTVENTGSGPATIGNIVANLQTRNGNKWETQSSDIADATNGDDATSAQIHAAASSEGLASFSENGASGELQFMDATNNTVFSLVPQVEIGAGESRSLLFQAVYDNNVLDLADGTPIRGEIIVSFGNASNGNSTANVDINGNGTLDPDEARVRSVPARLGVQVPAALNGNATVTLTDALDDIATTGTVSFSNAHFNLGATSGTVTVTVDGGTDGGSITNCAHLEGASSTVSAGGFTFPVVNGVDLEDCSTITIGATTCTPGTAGCGWRDGDLVTANQAAWGDAGRPAGQLMSNRFFTVYSSGIAEIGIPGTAGYSVRFTDPAFVLLYLPSTGAYAALNADLVDPSTTSSGAFGGEVLALKFNVDFAALTGGTANVAFGDLHLCNMTPSSLDGTTVSSVLGQANTLLGGGTATLTIAEAAAVLLNLNNAFTTGIPSSFAQSHLVNGPCP